MNKIIFITLLVLMMMGCSYGTYDNEDYSAKETRSGTITKIEQNKIYVDNAPFNDVQNATDIKVGQRVKVTFIDTTSEDVWAADDFIVKNIEILK